MSGDRCASHNNARDVQLGVKLLATSLLQHFINTSTAREYHGTCRFRSVLQSTTVYEGKNERKSPVSYTSSDHEFMGAEEVGYQDK